jgi:two-component system OmpR family response regulator
VNQTKVLIIEDDELLREIYSTKFELEGFAVGTARDGKEGLMAAHTQAPDIILVDMIMPRMSGLDFLRAYKPAGLLRQAKTVVMSNKSSPAEINQAKALGVLDYLIKSQHTPDEIVRKVRSYLNPAET